MLQNEVLKQLSGWLWTDRDGVCKLHWTVGMALTVSTTATPVTQTKTDEKTR